MHMQRNFMHSDGNVTLVFKFAWKIGPKTENKVLFRYLWKSNFGLNSHKSCIFDGEEMFKVNEKKKKNK